MVPAAPPPTMRTLWCSEPPECPGRARRAASSSWCAVLGQLHKGVDARIGERGVVDVQRQFLDMGTIEVSPEAGNERLVLFGTSPGPLVVPGQILRPSLRVLAESFERNQHAHRSFGATQTLGHGAAERPE